MFLVLVGWGDVGDCIFAGRCEIYVKRLSFTFYVKFLRDSKFSVLTALACLGDAGKHTFACGCGIFSVLPAPVAQRPPAV